jgi:hypothetical protein
MALHRFRYPVKVFFTVHLAVSLLAAMGCHALATGRRDAWRRLATIGLVLGGLLVAVRLLPAALPGPADWFARGFFPPGYSAPLREERLAFVLQDAALGGAVTIVAGIVALAVRSGRFRVAFGGLALVGLVAGDLLRTGASLNPMVPRSFYRLSPEMAGVVATIKARGGRVYTCRPEDSAAYWKGRAQRAAAHEAWTFATAFETLNPNFNMNVGLPSALSEDLTSLVPLTAVPPPDASCSRIDRLIGRLRTAAVTHVLSLDPIDSPALSLAGVVTPARIAPLEVHVYELRDPLPMQSLIRWPIDPSGTPPEGAGRLTVEAEAPGRLTLRVEASEPAAVLVRQSCARGWTATVNAESVPVLPGPDGHCVVPVGRGSSRVHLVYRPPGWTAGVLISSSSLSIVLAIVWSAKRRRRSNVPDQVAR